MAKDAKLPNRKDTDVRQPNGHEITFRWWRNSLGRLTFMTLHVSSEMAEQFVLETKKRGWVSTPTKTLHKAFVSTDQFIEICDAIADGTGTRMSLS